MLLVKKPMKNVNWHITENKVQTLCEKFVPENYTHLPMRFITQNKVCKRCQRIFKKL